MNGLSQILDKFFEVVLLELREFYGSEMGINGVCMRFYTFVCSACLLKNSGHKMVGTKCILR